MGRYIGNEYVEKVKPVKPEDVKRLKAKVREEYGREGAVRIEKGRGSIPSEVTVSVCGVDIASAEMRHHEGDILDILPKFKDAMRDIRDELASEAESIRWEERALKERKAEYTKKTRSIKRLLGPFAMTYARTR